MAKTYIEVKHNMEVAHRLYESPGKCENIHGHSMWVRLRMFGPLNDKGMLVNSYGLSLEFGEVKFAFRNYLDSTFDHHVILNTLDPWAQPLMNHRQYKPDGEHIASGPYAFECLPGLKAISGDPTTENLAMIICTWSSKQFSVPNLEVHVAETPVNSAGVILGGD